MHQARPFTEPSCLFFAIYQGDDRTKGGLNREYSRLNIDFNCLLTKPVYNENSG